MSGGRITKGGSARKAALLALCALACSSGVDSYRVGESGGSGGTVPASGGTTGDGGAGQSGAGAGGAATTGGAAGRTAGGTENGGNGAESGSPATGGEGGAKATGGTGGSSGSGPQPVDLDQSKWTDITAAAWGASSFFFLEAAAHHFWRVDPTQGSIAGPFDLPDVTVSPHVFAASSDSVYIVGGDKVYRVPHAGSSTVPGATLVTTGLTSPSGAYAKGYFLIGDAAKSASAQLFSDDSGQVIPQGSLGRIYAVASDGSNFAFSTLDTARGQMRIHDVPSSATLKPSDTPCVGGSVAAAEYPISVYGQTVAWVLPAADRKLLFFASLTNGTCPQNIPDQVIFGGAAGPNVVALIDESRALVVDSYTSGSGKVIIVGRSGGTTDPVTVMFGGTHQPSAIVAGGQHYAAIVAEAKPAVIRF